MKKCFYAIILFLLGIVSATSLAQEDGLNLPTEFYVLLNSGEVQRYGIGAAGVTTITPEGGFVLDFAIAPDGDWMGYRTEEGLYLLRLSTDVSSVVQVEGATADVPAIRGQGDTMAWTPTGDALAYTTLYGARVYFPGGTFTDIAVSPLKNLVWSLNGTYLAAEAEGNIWWIYRRDGTSMTLTSALPSSIGLVWLDNTRFVFAPAEGGLIMMDVGNANFQTPLTAPDVVYALPALRGAQGVDGSLVAFARETIDGQPFDFFQTFTTNADGSLTPAERSAAPVDLNDVRWAPGGNLMIAFRGGAIALVLPTTGEGFVLPVTDAVAYGWGAPRPPTVTSFTLSVDGYFRAVDGTGFLQIWRLPQNGLPAMPMTSAEEDVADYAISNNALVYLSAGEIWLVGLEGNSTEAIALAAVDASAREVAISPDGATLAYTTDNGIFIRSTEAENNASSDSTEEASAVAQTSPTLGSSAGTIYRHPQFATNINALLVTVTIGDDTELQLYDLASGELLTLGGYVGGEWGSDGRLLAVDSVGNSIYLVDPLMPQATTGSALTLVGRIIDSQTTDSGLLRVIEGSLPTQGPAPLRLYETPLAGGGLTDLGIIGFLGQPQLSPDGNFIAGYAQSGATSGTLVIYDGSAGTALSLALPPTVTDFKWGES